MARPTISAVPTAPNRSSQDQSTFNTNVSGLLSAMPTIASEVEAFNAYLNGTAGNLSGVRHWVSSTSYIQGDEVYSALTGVLYRAKTTHSGATDPSVDSTNWAASGGISAAAQAKLDLITFPVGPVDLDSALAAFAATANGAITKGTAVAIRSDGGVEAVSGSRTAHADGGDTEITTSAASASLGSPKAVKISSTQVLIAHNGNSTYRCQFTVGTWNGSSWSFGTSLQPDSTSYYGWDLHWDSSISRAVCILWNSSNQLVYKILSVSGTTVTQQGTTTHSPGTSTSRYGGSAISGDGRGVAICENHIATFTYNASSATARSADLSTVYTSGWNIWRYVFYLPTDDRFIIFGRAGTSGLYITEVTVSGVGAISVQTGNGIFDLNPGGTYWIPCNDGTTTGSAYESTSYGNITQIEEDYFLFTFETQGSNPAVTDGVYSGLVKRNSAYSFTAGTFKLMSTISYPHYNAYPPNGAIYCPNRSVLAIVVTDASHATIGYVSLSYNLATLEVEKLAETDVSSGTNIRLGSFVQLDDTSDEAFMFWHDDPGTVDDWVTEVTLSGLETNAENVVGFAGATVADTEDCPVISSGGVASGLSGLVANRSYVLEKDTGALAPGEPGGGVVYAGRALSTTELLVGIDVQ